MRRHIRWIRIAAVSLVATLGPACTPGGGGSTATGRPERTGRHAGRRRHRLLSRSLGPLSVSLLECVG